MLIYLFLPFCTVNNLTFSVKKYIDQNITTNSVVGTTGTCKQEPRTQTVKAMHWTRFNHRFLNTQLQQCCVLKKSR